MDSRTHTSHVPNGLDRHEVLTMLPEMKPANRAIQAGRTNRRARGQSLIEMAFITPIFLVMLVGMVEYGRVLLTQHVITNAAREGARLAVVFGASDTTVQSTVNSLISNGSLTLSKATITIAGNGGATGSTASVTISYPYQSVILQLIHYNSGTVTLTTTAKMVHE